MPVNLVGALLRGRMSPGSTVLHLFGGPAVRCDNGARLPVPEGSKRLLVYVALHAGDVDRRHAAGVLWPFGDDERAAGNLRSALWRLNRASAHMVVADKRVLALRTNVMIDLRLVGDWADRMISGSPTAADLTVLPDSLDSFELLPGWYDDWVVLERERIRQRLLHGLEALSRAHRQAGRWALAVEAATVAVSGEPLRESAQLELLESHLAEGNWIEGVRCYESYRELLRREVGVEPGAELRGVLNSRLIGAPAPRRMARAALRPTISAAGPGRELTAEV